MSLTLDDLPLSMRALIEDLEPGDTWSRTKRYDADETPKDLPIKALRAMRQSIQATVFRITERTGNEYKIEAGEWRTQSRDMMITLAVTRMD